MRRLKGLTLIELMLVILAMSIILSITVPYYLNQKQASRKEELLNQHADMYKLLVNAVGSWANTSYADIEDDTRGQITVDELKDNDYLPFQFAFQYSGTVAHDIMGLELKNWWNKSEVEWNGVTNQVIRTITTVDEAASWNSNPETFIPEKFAVIESEEQYNTFVGSWYLSLARFASERGLVAGRLKANSLTVTGVNQAWKIILDPNEFDIPVRPYQRIVFFWGWPDLNGFAGGIDTTTPEPPINEAGLYASCTVTTRFYFETNENSSQCDNLSGYKSLVDLESFSPAAPSPFYSIPGFGVFYSYVSRQAITDLSAIGSQCYSRGFQYCLARGGSAGINSCGTSNPDQRDILVQQCLSTPVYSVVNNVSLGGGIYKSQELYKDGSYNFGNVNGFNYEVDIGSELQGNVQYTFCCPNEVPNLEN